MVKKMLYRARFGGFGATICTWIIVLCASLMLKPVLPGATENTMYTLGIGDQLRIVVFQRPDLSGEFTVQSPGLLSIPGIGALPVSDVTSQQLEGAIAAILRDQHMSNPMVTVEVVKYRPFFILGDVQSPGEYEYVSNMTVLHALAIAGGYRAVASQDFKVRSEVVTAKADLRIAEISYLGALARKARFEFERLVQDGPRFGAAGKFIVFPPEFAANAEDKHVAELMEGERRLFEARSTALDGEIEILNQQKEAFRQEIAALEGQLKSLDTQMKLIRVELQDKQSMVNQGLSPKPQLLELQRIEADLQGDSSEASAFIARALQSVAVVEQSILNLKTQRKIAVNQSLGELHQDLQTLKVQRESAQARLDVAMDEMPNVRLADENEAAGQILILRETTEEREFIPATETTTVLPGDVIVVPERLPQSTESAPRAAFSPRMDERPSVESSLGRVQPAIQIDKSPGGDS